MKAKSRCEIGRKEDIQAKVKREKIFKAEGVNVCECRGQGGDGGRVCNQLGQKAQ